MKVKAGHLVTGFWSLAANGMNPKSESEKLLSKWFYD
jgi:hypothetical protein